MHDVFLRYVCDEIPYRIPDDSLLSITSHSYSHPSSFLLLCLCLIRKCRLAGSYIICSHDHSEVMTTAIENVLTTRDPSLTDENDWEEFSLTDVKVRLPGKSRYANILSASPDFSVTVTGQLEIVEEDQEHLGT